MEFRQFETSIIIGASMIFVLLTISFLSISPSDTLAQGTNATNATNATSTAGGGNQTTVVMPLGSSAATSGDGYEPPTVTV
jgi:hypothetical protein